MSEDELKAIADLVDEKIVKEENVIGNGTFGTVVKIMYENSFVAVKRLQKRNIPTIKREIEMLKSVSIPKCSDKILCFKQSYEGENYFYIMTEYIENSQTLDKLDTAFIPVVLPILALAIQELHKMNFIHYDIKPENVLVYGADEDKKLKLIDLGMACSEKEIEAEEQSCKNAQHKGSAYFAPPETLDMTCAEIKGKYTFEHAKGWDIYAFFDTMYTLWHPGFRDQYTSRHKKYSREAVKHEQDLDKQFACTYQYGVKTWFAHLDDGFADWVHMELLNEKMDLFRTKVMLHDAFHRDPLRRNKAFETLLTAFRQQ